MCNFFSAVVRKEGRKVKIYFTEEDSHSTILTRLGETDGAYAEGTWACVECEPPFDEVVLDAPSKAPIWYAKQREAIEKRIKKLARKIAPLYADYRARYAALYADYRARYAPLYADYRAKCDALYADYRATLSVIDGYVPAKDGE